MTHNVLHSHKLNYDTKGDRYYLLMELTPEKLEERRENKKWFCMCSGKTKEELVSNAVKKDFGLTKYKNGVSFVKDVYIQRLKRQSTYVEDIFYNYFDICSTEHASFSEVDLDLIREYLAPYNKLRKMFDDKEIYEMKKDIGNKLLSAATPNDRNYSEVIDVFLSHIFHIVVKAK